MILLLLLLSAQDELLEVKTQYEVKLDSAALETRQLKAQVRSLCDNQSLTDVFATFEENVARLTRENQALRQANLHLAAKELDGLMQTQERRVPIARRSSSRSATNMLHAQERSADAAATASADQSNEEESRNESNRLQVLRKENLRLVTRLKKAGQEKDALRTSYEELKLKERQFAVNIKIANDCARRLRTTHQELVKTKRELEIETATRQAVERDLKLIREDTQSLRMSEAQLREERSRYLSELAVMRERVREVDHESRRLAQLNRFVEKHAQPAAASSSRSAGQGGQPAAAREKGKAGKAVPPLPVQVNPYRAHIAAVLSSAGQPESSRSVPLEETKEFSAHFPVHPADLRGSRESLDPHSLQETAEPESSSNRSAGMVGQAGLSDAPYLRYEESDGIEPSLEVSLTAMHESLIATQPSLLPLFRRLTDDIHTERTRALQKRSQLLSAVAPRQYDTKPATVPEQSASPAHNTSAQYANMVKALVAQQQSSNNYAGSYEEKLLSSLSQNANNRSSSSGSSSRGGPKKVRF